MIITDNTDYLIDSPVKTAVTIGKFDGLHLGHLELIRRVTERKADGLLAVVFLIGRPGFENSEQKRILDAEEEEEILRESGADLLVRVPFTQEFARRTAEDFVKNTLIRGLHASFVVSGDDFCFGAGRQGNPEFLNSILGTLGFEYECVPRVFYENRPVSSSRIRDSLLSGKIREANAQTGRPYTVRGTVIHGMHLGTGLGFPTANIRPPAEKLLPRFGVYRVFAEIDGVRHKGLADIGVKPTVSEQAEPLLEVHFPDYSGDLYGSCLHVGFDEFLRPERKFDSVSELKAQISRDLALL